MRQPRLPPALRLAGDGVLLRALAAARRQAGCDLTFASLLREPERVSLGVFADRPRLARVYDAPAERLDPLQRLGDIAHREVRQREGIAGSASASMDADRWLARVRLPACSLSGLAILQFNAEEVHPEGTGALWIVCGKLNERERRVRHGPHDTPLAEVPGRCNSLDNDRIEDPLGRSPRVRSRLYTNVCSAKVRVVDRARFTLAHLDDP